MYAKINFPKGRNFRICFVNPSNEYIIDSGGILITLEKNGLKYGIGSRVYYNTFEDAFAQAALWQTLINESTTYYKYRVIIYDTNKVGNLWGKYLTDVKNNNGVTVLKVA